MFNTTFEDAVCASPKTVCLLTVSGNVHHISWHLISTIWFRSPICAIFLGNFRHHNAPSWLHFSLLGYVRSGQLSLTQLKLYCAYLENIHFKASPLVCWYMWVRSS